MENPTKVTLSLIGWLFLFQITSAQTVNRNAWNIGLSTGVADLGGNKKYDVKGYYHVGLNLGYFPATDFAFGLKLDVSSIDGSYQAIGLGPFIHHYFARNVSYKADFEIGFTSELTDYNKFMFSLGYALFPGKSFALEPNVTYIFHSEPVSSNFNGPGIGLGIQWFINRT